MYKNFIEETYNINNIEFNLLDSSEENMPSFIKVEPGEYPPRYEFEKYSHNLKKENIYILKFEGEGRATFAINKKEVKIIDMFLKDDFQGKSILKNILTTIRAFIMQDHPLVEFITLNSLPSGIIAWHKMGFEFYNKLDRISIKSILSSHLQEKVDLLNLSKKHVEDSDCYKIL